MNEVARIKVELEKAFSANDGKKTMELLELLVNMPVTMMVLQDTHIGLTVNKIRKSLDHPEAVALCKKVVKKWKKMAESYKQQSSDPTSTSQNNNNNGTSSIQETTSNTTDTSNNNSNNSSVSNAIATNAQASDQSALSEEQQLQQPQAPTTSAKDGSNNIISSNVASPATLKRKDPPSSSHAKPSFIAKEVPQTNSALRLKYRQMISDTLKQPLPKEFQNQEPFLDEESLAARIEDHIYQEFKSDTDLRYRNRVRSRITNLKDAKNPHLRLNVLRGDISAERMAKMTPEEMASPELKKQREQFTKEAINDHQMALTGGTSSSEIKCPACKKYDCSYNQMQTRSADEPMTTFCHCNNCGKRWKFC